MTKLNVQGHFHNIQIPFCKNSILSYYSFILPAHLRLSLCPIKQMRRFLMFLFTVGYASCVSLPTVIEISSFQDNFKTLICNSKVVYRRFGVVNHKIFPALSEK